MMGGFSVVDRSGTQRLPKFRKSMGVLAYLFFARGSEVQRSTLAEMFWPDNERTMALSNLRRAIYEIKICFGADADSVLIISRKSVALRKEVTTLDLWSSDGTMNFEVEGVLFEGLEPVSPFFDEWLYNQRRRIDNLLVSQAEGVLNAPNTEPELALRAAESILNRDPHNEAAARRAIEIHATQGNLSKAIRIYETVEKALKDDGFELDPQTREVYATLRRFRDRPAAKTTLSRATETKRPNVAVCHAQALVHPQDDSPVSRMCSELSAALGTQFSTNLAVRFAFRDTVAAPVGPARLRSLDARSVNYAVFLQLRPTALGMTVKFELYRVTDGQELSTLQFQRTADPQESDLSELARAVSAHIVERIECCEMYGVDQHRSTPWSGYDHYLHARLLLRDGARGKNLEDARQHLENAVDLAPDLPLAKVYLGHFLNSAYFGLAPGLPREPGVRRAFTLARALIQNHQTLPEAHLLLAWCLINLKQFDAAQASLNHAIEDNLTCPDQWRSAACAALCLGGYTAAETCLRTASQRQISDYGVDRSTDALFEYLTANPEHALRHLQASDSQALLTTEVLRAACLAQLGRLAEASKARDAALSYGADMWCGSDDFSEAAAVSWFFGAYPFREPSARDLLLNGLAKAGFRIS